MTSRLIAIITVLLCAAACEDSSMSRDDFDHMVQLAQRCEPGDTCVLAGSGACTCAVAVNAEEAESIDEAVEDVDCEGTTVICAQFTNPRCEDNICVADIAE